MPELSGKCFCGKVNWRAKGEMLWAAICHCEDCRKAASSDSVSWFGVFKDKVEWSGERQFYKSSAKVVRSFCGSCGAPLTFESEVFPEETHIYAITLDDLSHYKPTAHIFWSERVPWVQVADDMPKHEKGLQDAAAKGVTLL